MFSFFVSASLRSRTLVLVIAAVIIALGVYAQQEMAVDVFPNLNKGTLTILTEAPGFAPEEVETLVTMPIEAAVAGTMGLSRIRSNSTAGLSIVFAEFDWGTDLFRARQLLTEQLTTAHASLPDDVRPQLMPTVSLMGEILIIALSGGNDPMLARETADWVVAPRLRAVPGVARVNAMGGQVRQYRVTPDLAKLNLLGITIQDMETALEQFGSNSGGGVIDQHAQEYQIRIVGRSTTLDDLRNVSIQLRGGQPVLLHQLADVSFQPQQRRGDAGYMGSPAVVMLIQKQLGADTLDLTHRLGLAIESLDASMPPGMKLNQIVFRQADFIEASIGNVEQVLLEAMVVVAVILFLFLANVRTTAISLVAIPVSVLITFVVFRWVGLSLNTMTLGGLAIAIGELVDDAVVDVENIYRRLSENRLLPNPRPALTVIADASQEVRSGIVQSTMIIIVVFVPVFAIPGIEGMFFAPLGVAYIVSIFASLIVSLTLTPVLCSYFLPQMKRLSHQESWFVRQLKRGNRWLLERVLNRPAPFVVGVGVACFLAISIVPTIPRAFLPRFNEGSIMIEMALEPGISLEESVRIARVAERVLLGIPEIVSVGRRTGRAENDELAQGVHLSELETTVVLGKRPMPEVMRDVRQRLASLPGTYNIGQPIGHRLIDHMLTGAAAQIVLKIFGEDIDVLRNIAGVVEARLGSVPGLVDLAIEKQVPIPQIRVTVDPQKAMLYGVQPGVLTRHLAHLINGVEISQIVNG
ncbi:MAG: efflux RND transporter permease subunit, partial [Alphaproteobacteria bacterium]